MKKLILSAIMLSAATVAVNAQANSVLVYGNLGYHSTKNADDSKSRSYNISPGVGYQFDKHWTVGVYGSFGSDRTSIPATLLTNETWNFENNYGAGVFVRHTIGLGKIFAIFNQLEAGYIGATAGIKGVDGSVSANGFRSSLTPNIGVNVYKGFALNFNFGGIDYSTLSSHGVSAQAFNLSFGTQVNVGISKNIFCGNKHHAVKTNHNSDAEESTIEKDSE